MICEFFLSNDATFVSLSSIAGNVDGVIHATIESLPDKKCVFASDGNGIIICYERDRISFSKDKIKCFDIVPVTSADVIFYAATIEFYSDGESLRYGIVIVPGAELCWLRVSADQIGEVLSKPPLDLTQISQ